MAFNIQNFSAEISKRGTLQNNKFKVRIAIPASLLSISRYSNAQEILEFRANEVSVPGVTMDTSDYRRYGIGPIQKTATNVRFTEIDVSFIETRDSYVHRFFYDWTNFIFDYSGSGPNREVRPTFTSEYKANYATTVEIMVFNNSGTSDGSLDTSGADSVPVSTIKLFDAFPVALSDVGLDWSSTNQLYRVRTSLNFSYWRREGPVTKNDGWFLTREDLPPIPGVNTLENPNRDLDSAYRFLDSLREQQRFRDRNQ